MDYYLFVKVLSQQPSHGLLPVRYSAISAAITRIITCSLECYLSSYYKDYYLFVRVLSQGVFEKFPAEMKAWQCRTITLHITRGPPSLSYPQHTRENLDCRTHYKTGIPLKISYECHELCHMSVMKLCPMSVMKLCHLGVMKLCHMSVMKLCHMSVMKLCHMSVMKLCHMSVMKLCHMSVMKLCHISVMKVYHMSVMHLRATYDFKLMYSHVDCIYRNNTHF